MPLIEVTEQSNGAFGMGTMAPHADGKKFRSMWACVEGQNDGRWPSVREAVEGIRVGNDGRKKLPYEEFKDGKCKPHDITVGNVKLREMIVPIEDARAKDAYEAALSRREVETFSDRIEEKTSLTHGRASVEISHDTHQLQNE